MLPAPVPQKLKLIAAAAFAIAGFSAAPAGAVICPGGVPAPYCITPAGTHYRDDTRGYGPTLYFRLGDASGSSVMAGDNGLPSGEYKNWQDSNPIGIADDHDAARDFFGDGGYGYVNGIDAPNWNGSSPYGNYTMEAWIKPYTGVTDGGILEFGRGGSVYMQANQLYFRNGDDLAGPAPLAIGSSQWYFVTATKCGQTMTLSVQASDGVTPTAYLPSTATGTSIYRPEGQPTFYVGLDNQQDTGTLWFDGAMDEVAYFTSCLTSNEMAVQYYDDPAPSPQTMVRTPAALSQKTPGKTVAKTPATHARPLTRAQKITRAKRTVSSLAYALKRAKIQYSTLQISGAPKKQLARARAGIKDISKRLAAAKKALHKLQHHAPKRH